MGAAGDAQVGLRERKRVHTRAAIIDAATELFRENGYRNTTLTQVAAAAGIAPRTFFGYFPTKVDLLFPESDARIDAAVTTLLERGSADRASPVQVLLQALDLALDTSDDMTGKLATVRTQLLRDEPEVAVIAAQFQYKASQKIAAALTRAYPHLTAVDAGALAGAFVGAAGGAVDATLQLSDPSGGNDRQSALIRAAVGHVLLAEG